MSPLRRGNANKRRSARTFRRHGRRTKAANMRGPNRGGYRL